MFARRDWDIKGCVTIYAFPLTDYCSIFAIEKGTKIKQKEAMFGPYLKRYK